MSLQIKKKSTEKAFIAFVDSKLLKKVVIKKRKEKLKWKQIVEASFNEYLKG